MLDRRSFLRGVAAAPLAAVPLSAPLPGRACDFSRVSCEKGDPGELAYCLACADGKSIKVFLDGVEQKLAVTADTAQGFVKRAIESDGGNLAFNRRTGEIFHEVVHGRVEIRIADKVIT